MIFKVYKSKYLFQITYPYKGRNNAENLTGLNNQYKMLKNEVFHAY